MDDQIILPAVSCHMGSATQPLVTEGSVTGQNPVGGILVRICASRNRRLFGIN